VNGGSVRSGRGRRGVCLLLLEGWEWEGEGEEEDEDG